MSAAPPICGAAAWRRWLSFSRSFSRSWATLAARPHLCIYGNIQDEFCPARMSHNTKLPMRLFSESIYEAHSETISLGNLKVRAQPQSLIADRDASDVAVDAPEAGADRPARTIWVGMPGGICDPFTDNQRQIDGVVRIYENFGP